MVRTFAAVAIKREIGKTFMNGSWQNRNSRKVKRTLKRMEAADNQHLSEDFKVESI